MNAVKPEISHVPAAEILADRIRVTGRKVRVWNMKDGETRIYTQYGYLKSSLPTEKTAQLQYFTKSYEISELKPLVEVFDEEYAIASIPAQPQFNGKVLMQEDEDGMIGLEDWHEPDVYIVREWYE
jgi:hypothetical protein